ncbi:MAG: hypothetical protein NC924_08300 [Candidatus Omnitrophica bacterium]|nr:hypothetical protein [Candidatus Omnitrophota bacterium]
MSRRGKRIVSSIMIAALWAGSGNSSFAAAAARQLPNPCSGAASMLSPRLAMSAAGFSNTYASNPFENISPRFIQQESSLWDVVVRLAEEVKREPFPADSQPFKQLQLLEQAGVISPDLTRELIALDRLPVTGFEADFYSFRHVAVSPLNAAQWIIGNAPDAANIAVHAQYLRALADADSDQKKAIDWSRVPAKNYLSLLSDADETVSQTAAVALAALRAAAGDAFNRIPAFQEIQQFRDAISDAGAGKSGDGTRLDTYRYAVHFLAAVQQASALEADWQYRFYDYVTPALVSLAASFHEPGVRERFFDGVAALFLSRTIMPQQLLDAMAARMGDFFDQTAVEGRAYEDRARFIQWWANVKKFQPAQRYMPKSEFETYELVWDRENKTFQLLVEPAGIPGHWLAQANPATVSGAAANALIERATRSFALTTAKQFPEHAWHGTLRLGYGEDSELSVNFDIEAGWQVKMGIDFLRQDILSQRRQIAALIENITVSAPLQPPALAIDSTNVLKGKRVVVFSSPIFKFHQDKNKSVGGTPLALASFFHQQRSIVNINNDSFMQWPVGDRDRRAADVVRLRVLLHDTDVVALSAYHYEIPELRDFILMVREAVPQVTIVIGGATVLTDPKRSFAWLSEADVIYRGSIETKNFLDTLAVLFGLRDGGLALPGVNLYSRNISSAIIRYGENYFFNHANEITRSTADEMRQRLPDFSLYNEINAPTNFLPVEGCSQQCVFCLTINGKIFRVYSEDDIINTAWNLQKRLLELGNDPDSGDAWRIMIASDNFFQNKQYALRILRRFLAEQENGLRIKIGSAAARLDTFLTGKPGSAAWWVDTQFIDELVSLKAVFSGDVVQIVVGTEDVLDAEIDYLGKGKYRQEHIKAVLDYCSSKGDIWLKHFAILTNPVTRVQDLVVKLKMMYEWEKLFPGNVFDSTNPGIIPFFGTKVVNGAVQAGLFEYYSLAHVKIVPLMPEYDFIDALLMIRSQFIEQGFFEQAINMYRITGKNFTSGKLFYFLSNTLRWIDDHLYLMGTNELRLFTGLLSPEVQQEFSTWESEGIAPAEEIAQLKLQWQRIIEKLQKLVQEYPEVAPAYGEEAADQTTAAFLPAPGIGASSGVETAI